MTPYHSMEIYEDEASIAVIITDLFRQSLSLNQPCLLIARPSVISRVRDIVGHAEVDSGAITMINSRDVLQALADDNLPDPVKFREMVGSLLETICSGRAMCIVTIYADMADILLSQNNVMGAVALELLWNELAARYAFTLVCGYSAAAMHERIPSLEDLERICLEHNRINLPRPHS